MTARFYLICSLIGVSFLACRHQTKTSSAKLDSTTNTNSNPIDSLQNMVYLMISPNEILDEIFSKKPKLNSQLLNPRNNAQKYLDVKHQALNLGVYIADFAYLNLCENKSYSLDYFKIIRDLAQKNSIYGCFDESVFNRIQNNLANNDSLISISQEMYYNMTDILENANRQNINALITSGALVESLYLSIMNIDKPLECKDIKQKIFEQKPLFDNFYSFISTYKKDKDVKSVAIQLDELKKILDKSGITTQKTKTTKNNKTHLEVKGGQDIAVNETAFKEFKESVIKIRQTFITIN